MFRYTITRLVQAFVAIFGITTVVFLLLRISGDPVTLFMTEATTPEQEAALRRELGFDDPLPIQYLRFMKGAATGDFGTSLRLGRPAMEVVLERLGATMQLTIAALVLSILIGVPAGVLSAAKRGSIIDQVTMVGSVIGQGVPVFVLGIILIWIFSVKFQVLPVGGRGGISNLVLPTVALATYSLARLARLSRSAMLEVLGEDYIRTARAKGLRDFMVLYRHALKNASIPIITAVGLSFSTFFGGAVITETIFSWPGIGRMLVQAVGQRDYPVVQAAVFVTAVFVVAVNLITDLMYAFLNPRIRYS